MKGLTSQQVRHLLAQHGLNVILDQRKKPIYLKFFEQFNNFLTVLLLLAAGLSFFVGESIDAILILGIVVLNAIFGLYQEVKAEQSIAALKKMTVTKIRVVRNNVEQEIDSKYLVPGDLIMVEEGVKVPADARVTESINLEVDEASLTGESLPVGKADGKEIFMGTIVAKGRGYAKVYATGMNSKFGNIAESLSRIQEVKTPLQKKLENLSKKIGAGGIVLSFVVLILSILQGSTYFPAFLLAISLAVAVVPEGLPAVMTITLAIGVKEMAKKKAIIRKLSAIEALGSVTLIATDKTGTLTTNKMKVKEIYADGKKFEVGRGKIENFPAREHLLLDGLLCSTATLVYVHDHGSWDVLGDPTEGALLYLAQESGLAPEIVKKEWKLIKEVPFDSVSKRMTVVVEKDREKVTYTKGAPESILEISTHILLGKKVVPISDSVKNRLEARVEQWASRGLRVLAFSYSTGSKPAGGDIFVGMVAIHDAPRPEVTDAVKKARNAGIKVVMITGDNEKTAEAIGVSSGIIKYGDEILDGYEIDKYSDQELLELLPRVRIFARTTPFHKHRIVSLYQRLGEIVVVTGDGVNDAIALKQADVGVAMGLVGTDVAREAADMVITDDNFATIVNAVEEGRNIIKNIKNAIKYLLSCNVSEALSLLIALVLGIPNLFFAIQLLYINLVTDGFPALALAFSHRQKDLMSTHPSREAELMSGFGKRYIYTVGILATFLVIFTYFIFADGSGASRTGAFSVLALIQSFIFADLWFSHFSIKRHFKKLLSGIFLLAFIVPFIIQYIIVTTPTFARGFRIETVSSTTFLVYILIASLIFVATKALRKFLGH